MAAKSSAPVNTSILQTPRHKQQEAFTIPSDFELSVPKPQSNGRRRLYALIVSVVLMITISALAIALPKYLDISDLVSAVSSAPEVNAGDRDKTEAGAATNTPRTQREAEKQVRTEAEQEFQQLLQRWRQQQN